MRSLFFIFFLLIQLVPVFSQDYNAALKNLITQYKNSNRDSNAVELLLRIDSIYLYKLTDDDVILDSALLMAQQAKNLSSSIHFETGYEDAVFLIGNTYAEKKICSQQ